MNYRLWVYELTYNHANWPWIHVLMVIPNIESCAMQFTT